MLEQASVEKQVGSKATGTDDEDLCELKLKDQRSIKTKILRKTVHKYCLTMSSKITNFGLEKTIG